MIAEQDRFFETGEIPLEPPLDEALAKVNPLVEDAINKIEVYVLPYFSEVASRLGYSHSVAELAKKTRNHHS